ncbi:hypothetical protein SAMN05660657_05469 [Geodermatophilus amargosae]|uniref:Uncharacterized protein n=1 Tax=Geodermatophilus amargosae TaxID=1296565 RepID=A0A1I7D8D9_9ACTN|nr:hypothetical protein [Geodermatophilus amargosae]SFU08013.1 hypothetical protein SAMN05660657_05469 [Geodermatophilus amargosae]
MTEPSAQLTAAADRVGTPPTAEYDALLASAARELSEGDRHPQPPRADRPDGAPSTGPRPDDADLRREEVRSLLLAYAVAGRLVTDPDTTLAVARENLRRMRQSVTGGSATVWLDAWQRLLDCPLPELLATLTSTSSWSCDLRQNSPFAGVLTPQERAQVLATHRRLAGRR